VAEDRQEAVPAVVGVEQGGLLTATHRITGVVDVEHDPAQHVLEAVAEQLDHGRCHPLQRGNVRQVLERAHGGLRAQVNPALGRSAQRRLERRV
jgi:hypothetical protein